MLTAKLSTKGQLVVPKAIRDHLHLNAGDRLDFIIRDDGEVMIRPAVVDVRDLKGLLHKSGRAAVSLAEMRHVARNRIAGEASSQKSPTRKRPPGRRPNRRTKARQ
jgi:antitoxin PrlF